MSDDSDLGIVPIADHADDSDLGIKPMGAAPTTFGDVAQQGLKVAGKGLDYQRGAVGAPILAGIAAALSGKNQKDILSDQEYKDALNPTTTRRAPNADTMLARAGVPQGPAASSVVPALFQDPEEQSTKHWYDPTKYGPQKGGLLDVTPRGVAGGILDMATDPLTYESMGANKMAEAAKAAGESTPLVTKVLNPVSNATEALGVHNYEKGLAPLINKGEQYGKSDIADTFYKNGIYGKSSTIADMGDAAAQDLKTTRDALMEKAQQAGASPDTSKAFEPLVDHLSQLTADGRISHEDAMNVLDKAMGAKGSVENPTLSQMSQWKTDLSNSVPNSAYDVTKNPRMSQNFGKIAAGGSRDEVARAANAALPGSGDAINEANKDLGNFLTVQGVADKQAQRELNRKLLSPQDIGHAMIAGSAAGSPGAAATTLLGRIAAATMNNPAFRTSVGYGMRKAGTGALSAPVLDAAGASMLRNMANKNQPVAGVGK